jgi:hypothetical protein
MSNPPAPLQVVKKLIQDSEQAEDPEIQQDMNEGAETILFLLTLLKECASYIEDVNEYNAPPRFLAAVHDALS